MAFPWNNLTWVLLDMDGRDMPLHPGGHLHLMGLHIGIIRDHIAPRGDIPYGHHGKPHQGPTNQEDTPQEAPLFTNRSVSFSQIRSPHHNLHY